VRERQGFHIDHRQPIHNTHTHTHTHTHT
jgi:hypothetical protein